ncbi:MAG: MBL fold metallo-hydrolase, partial [Candidatus Zixiibacteriota bacterium]
MSRTISTVCLLLGVCFAAHAETPTRDAPDPIAISKFNDHLYVITTTGGPEFGLPPYGTNLVASVGPDGILLVDAGFGATGPALADTLKTMGDGNLRMLISTHYHGDHTFGNQFLSDQAVTIAHRNVLT